MVLTDADIKTLMAEITNRLAPGENQSPKRDTCNEPGCFSDIESAVTAAKKAQNKLAALSLEQRGKIIAAMREAARAKVRLVSEMAFQETGFGRINDKVIKNTLAIEKTPGIEDLPSRAYTGDNGLTLVESAPFGVIGAITPSTNPTATVINNAIGMVSAGNAVVFHPHPGAKRASNQMIELLNTAIASAGGPDNLLCTLGEPTLDSSRKLMEHPDVKLLVVTGGEAVVKVAMKSGKKVIAAGPGNPPVIVDDTANITKAAMDIVNGASFDNNILCIAEKEVLVFAKVADWFMAEMVRKQCYLLKEDEIPKVMALVLEKNHEGKYSPNKKFVGKDASYILRQSGIPVNEDYRLVIAAVDFEHPFVRTEMLMPVLPIVTVNNLGEAVEKAVIAENGCKHTAIMHSQNVGNLSTAARVLDTTIFVKNAPSYAGLGYLGEGFTTLTIATPTGEGLTSARTFTRQRRCTLSGSFRII